jgi:hypothetical protein
MQNQVIKAMVPEQLRKVTLHVFIYAKYLANMTQVSDVAPGPLVYVICFTGPTDPIFGKTKI